MSVEAESDVDRRMSVRRMLRPPSLDFPTFQKTAAERLLFQIGPNHRRICDLGPYSLSNAFQIRSSF